MISRKIIISEIQKIPEQYLLALYKIIKDFEAKRKMESKPSLMSELRNIQISAPRDFSQTADLYAVEDDNAR